MTASNPVESADGPCAQPGEIALLTASLAVVLRPDRGAEIRFIGAPDGPNVLFWQNWSTPLRASRSISYGDTERDWLSEWRGGWQELFPNAGAQATAMGIPLPFHGDASGARWEVVEASATDVTVRTSTRLPLTLTRRMWLALDRPVLNLAETVRNESDQEVPFLWGHHPAFDGVPGTVLDVPADRAVVPDGFEVDHADLAPGDYRWPQAVGRGGGELDLSVLPAGPLERVVYLPEVLAGWAALRRPDGIGVAMAWNADVHRHLWLWTEVGGVDFPWYGRSRVLAVEPVSSWPNDGLAAAVTRGRASHIGPGESISTWLTVSLFGSSDQKVVGVSRDGRVSLAPRIS